VQRLTGVAIRRCCLHYSAPCPRSPLVCGHVVVSMGRDPEATWTAVHPPAVSRQRSADALLQHPFGILLRRPLDDRSGALRPAAVFGAVGRKEAVRLQGEPRPPVVVVSPGGRNRCGSPPPGTRQAGQPHDPRLGAQPKVSTTLPPQAQKPWACTRSRLSFPDRITDVRSAVPSKIVWC
jgi:hypothetical protein